MKVFLLGEAKIQGDLEFTRSVKMLSDEANILVRADDSGLNENVAKLFGEASGSIRQDSPWISAIGIHARSLLVPCQATNTGTEELTIDSADVYKMVGLVMKYEGGSNLGAILHDS